MRPRVIFMAVMIVLFASGVPATVINIPEDYATIGMGIDASIDGDTVLVQPGFYYEHFAFNGRDIVVGSLFLISADTSYISQTIIDARSLDSVVRFVSGEDSTAVLTGFTIQHGQAINGAGIYCADSSPKIINNIIRLNADEEYGGGMYCENASPYIANNRFIDNLPSHDFPLHRLQV